MDSLNTSSPLIYVRQEVRKQVRTQNHLFSRLQYGIHQNEFAGIVAHQRLKG